MSNRERNKGNVEVSFDELEERAKKKETGPITSRELVISRAESGLYFCEFQPNGGRLPDMLCGLFTSKAKLESLVTRYKIEKA